MQYQCRKKIIEYTDIICGEFLCTSSVVIMYIIYFSFGYVFYFIMLFACIPVLFKMRKKIGKSVAFIKIKPDNKMIYYWPSNASDKEEYIEVDLNNAVDYSTYIKVIKKNKIIADYLDEITGFKMENGEFIQINKAHFKKILGKETKNFNKQVLQIIASNTGKNIEELGKPEEMSTGRKIVIRFAYIFVFIMFVLSLALVIAVCYLFFKDYKILLYA